MLQQSKDRRLKPLKVVAWLQTCIEIWGIFISMEKYTFRELREFSRKGKEIEHPIGEIVEIEHEQCKVCESNDKDRCEKCMAGGGDLDICLCLCCVDIDREDAKNVMYARL